MLRLINHQRFVLSINCLVHVHTYCLIHTYNLLRISVEFIVLIQCRIHCLHLLWVQMSSTLLVFVYRGTSPCGTSPPADWRPDGTQRKWYIIWYTFEIVIDLIFPFQFNSSSVDPKPLKGTLCNSRFITCTWDMYNIARTCSLEYIMHAMLIYI